MEAKGIGIKITKKVDDNNRRRRTKETFLPPHQRFGSSSAPSKRALLSGYQQIRCGRARRAQPPKSSSTTGSHQQEKHTSQEQVLKQPFHPHHHTGSAYCTVHATLLARYINRCPRGGREGSVNFWRCKKPPPITSPSQNFGTAQKPLPRVEDSE